MDNPSRKPGELVFNALMVLVSLVLLYQAYHITDHHTLSSPAAFPLSATAIMVFFSALNFYQSWQKRPVTQAIKGFFKHILPINVMVMMGLIALFALSLESIGFIISALVFLTAAVYIFYRQSWWRALSMALVALVGIYCIFRLVFLVILPEGVVPEGEVLAWLSALFNGGGQ
ncbi:Tripartite tricarboxylate transporter TctB family protein [Vibrio xiamenensis]|uniref:Tripartite tricarboxylate transporter TctB family protein n=1 Tax=Vibrio xiamenensis TaxID=861298 RepID=A0A1G8FB12_9VIBR|nr:tripartite tricarboxylate transporter TctB family protein [Vibrio xiamenensis]SDH79298.1 Tripartite tricarboxylate transporter TctB family protein [Vibrio xiamenensis]